MILDSISIVSNSEEWKQILFSLPEPCRDIYFTPEYLHVHAGDDPARVICLKYQEKELTWLFSGLLTPIHKIGNVSLPCGLFDLETAYGYGGPLSNSEDQSFLTRASQAFTEWAENNGVVTQFIRFHPLLGNERWIKDDQLEILFDRFTFSTDISKYDPDQTYYPKPTRNVIDRGMRLGLEGQVMEVDQGFPLFLELYQKTMMRLGADLDYFFDNFYFNRLRSLVKEHGILVCTQYKRHIIAAAVFLYGPYWMHYHLSASDYANRLPGATNIILDLAFQIARSKELRQVHLGGGRTTTIDDSLLRFKKSMSTDLNSFYIGKRIYNFTVYEELVATWKQEYPALVEKYQTRLLCYRYQS